MKTQKNKCSYCHGIMPIHKMNCGFAKRQIGAAIPVHIQPKSERENELLNDPEDNLWDESYTELDDRLGCAGICGCGHSHEGVAFLASLLKLMPAHNPANARALKMLVPDTGQLTFILWMLDAIGLTDHGSSVYGSWLSDKGKNLLVQLIKGEINEDSKD